MTKLFVADDATATWWNPAGLATGAALSGLYEWGEETQPADPLVVDGTGGAVVHVSTWSDGQSRLSGSIYRYVTWVDDPNIPGTEDAKRVTIAVTANNTDAGGTGQLKKPVLVSSVVIDPSAG